MAVSERSWLSAIANAILTSCRKKSQRVKEIKKGFKTALKTAGIKGLVWHDLRATFGTRAGEAGFDDFTIAALMGHSDIHTTARYVRATERNKRAAVRQRCSVPKSCPQIGHTPTTATCTRRRKLLKYKARRGSSDG